MGIIRKLIDDGHYGAFGKNVQIDAWPLATEKWGPIMYQAMILAYVGFSGGIILAIFTFVIELLSGRGKTRLQRRLLDVAVKQSNRHND